ncbi:hypothetical protein ACFOMD_02095 [Sphingoaurantiacus capsulatus]|uniref:Uncharacterized protein n=1 Tax=Sphingoaurantiacus capsulatus TaxID=1771310 RepID=A0ABV7X817_9SPHN
MIRDLLPLLLLAAAPALAAEGDTIRLSPEEIARIDAEAEARARAAPAEAEPKRRVHGEVEMSVGTGGSYGLGGAVNLPVGEHGAAALYGHTERLPQRPMRRNLDRR